ncbi:uncharacterized protein TEOVI_000242600 [Trypanosoma equiperdum]|uniref:Elongin-C n=2 Tax=Trypanozoon TaxID=39700 RepID=Q384S2_TRYB2|nr:hypothetical protein, conserved [Trypanosoma brucei brucei TREU927]EAN79709.1 hypothetical protein, conserved [Trypanosoma brucei brucei TREU927]SCU70851.1 hypothetical protein, conserved [Trypanosoma equiperdum]
MSRANVPFNPMRRTPPPPPCIDTFTLVPSDYMSMLSADGHKFVLHRDCACASPLIRKALTNLVDPGVPEMRFDWANGDNEPPVIYFTKAPTALLEVVIKYLYYKHRYEGDTDYRPPFDVPRQIALDIMKLAQVLQC